MTPYGLSQLTQRLPPELLEKVLMYVSVPDILRMKQVNRYLRDFTQDSPRIAYQIDIFAAGLKDNPTVDISLAEKRRLLDEYRARWDAFDPIQKSSKSFDGPENTSRWMSPVCGSGVFCLVTDPDDSIQFTKIESVSRGILRKEWKVPSPRGLELLDFAIYPQADVLAMVGSGEGGYSAHFLSMTTGESHPTAELPSLSLPGRRYYNQLSSLSITSCRFAVIMRSMWNELEAKVLVWDWRKGKLLLEQVDRRYSQLTFVNENSFVVISDSRQGGSPRLHVFNTKRGTTHRPAETSFSLPYNHSGSSFRLLSEPCGYAASSDELATAPFHPDPSQRIIALNFGEVLWFVVNAEKLLELALGWEGKNIQWDEWEAKLIRVTVGRVTGWDYAWVSGCRLFCIVFSGTGGQRSHLRVLDLSRPGNAKEFEALDRVGTGETGTRQWSPSLDGYELPWGHSAFLSGVLAVLHDSIVFGFSRDPISLAQGRMIHVWSF